MILQIYWFYVFRKTANGTVNKIIIWFFSHKNRASSDGSVQWSSESDDHLMGLPLGVTMNLLFEVKGRNEILILMLFLIPLPPPFLIAAKKSRKQATFQSFWCQGLTRPSPVVCTKIDISCLRDQYDMWGNRKGLEWFTHRIPLHDSMIVTTTKTVCPEEGECLSSHVLHLKSWGNLN